jgi:6-phosphogluconolactonase
MIDFLPEGVWTVLRDADAVAAEVAERVLEAAAAALDRDGEFRLVLAGGRTPVQAYRLLAGARTRWSGWRIYYGDERCLPPDHGERNSRAAFDAWLGKVPIAEEQLFPIPAERGSEAAARAYEKRVRAALPFHMVLLGMGEDGHTASLFPGRPEPPGMLVLPVTNAPKPPAERVSLSSTALGAAERVLILATGAAKREAVARWRAGEPLPVSRIRARRRLEVLLDREAAGDWP